MAENRKSNLNTIDDIKDWLVHHLANTLELDPQDIDTSERFNRYGLKSAVGTSMVAELSRVMGRKLMPTLVWDYPTIDKVAEYLADAGGPAPSESASTDVVRSNGGAAAARANSTGGPIAIIGMSCRFPGAPNPEKYWELLKNGVDAIQEVPTDRWSLNEFFSPDTSEPGKMSTRWGGFIDQVDQFDAGFFGISPREAIQMDPEQRLVLELCWEALEDAGINIPALTDSLTGVYIGKIWNDYATLSHRGNTDYIEQHTSTGSHYSIVANRVSYILGLQGPSMAVDTACSSSLVSVHLACQALRSGEATMAIAGGVNLIIAPDSTVNMSKFGAMAPDGRSKAFDHRANGYVRGEGAGVVVLKPLAAALADGDPIYSVIRGSAVNNDGPSNGLTAPNPASQQNVLRAAYRNADMPTTRVHYVETHGTGTMLGDPIEANALGAVLGAGRSKDRPLIIGSVKTNFGHLEAAAGMAGLIKLVLSMQHRAIPRSLHFEKPNPHIPFEDIGVEVNQNYRPWPNKEAAVGGVSSFGFGGTNCHVVLEEFVRSPAQLLAISADSPEGLQASAQNMLSAIQAEVRSEQASAESFRDIALQEICFSAARFLTRGSQRLALTAESKDDMARQLSAYLKGRAKPGIIAGEASAAAPKIVFFCPGQGGQWLGMGRELMRSEPIFRATLEQCDEAIQGVVGWSLLQELNADPADSRIENPQVDVIQPAIWAMQVAQAALWKSWGIVPEMVIGHSMGEVAAAYIAGILSIEDAARIICLRSVLAKKASGKGGMAVVELPAEECEALIAPKAGRVSVASCNSPTTTVLAGDSNDLQDIFADLESREIFCRLVNVDFASHSSQMDPLLDELFQVLRDVKPRKGTIPLFSTVTAAEIDGRQMNASYWVKNLRYTVQFAASLKSLLDDGFDTFIEMSPHPVLSNPVEQTIAYYKRSGSVLHTTRRDEDERAAILESLGRLYTLGAPVDWNALYSNARGVYELPATISAGTNGAGPSAPIEAEKTNADIFLLSAKTDEGLNEYAGIIADYLRSHEGVSLRDLSYTTALKRNHHDHRAAVIARSRPELIEALSAFASPDSTEDERIVRSRVDPKHNKKLAFVFTGQGAQWFAMGRQLMESEPVFRNKLQEIDELFQRFANWSIIAALQAEETASRIMETEVAQPAIFALQVSLAELWKHWSVQPGAVIGHSVGEVAAAHVAGFLSLDDATMLIYNRGKFMQEATGTGKMVHVALTGDDVEPYLAGVQDRVGVAAYNSPSSVVLSGETQALESVVAKLAAKDIYHKMLPVDYAFHSPQMEPYKNELIKAIASITPGDGQLPMYSTVHAKRMTGWEVEAEYWGDNIREPVRFAQAMDVLIRDGYANFIEIGPHPALSNYVTECVERAEREATVVHSLNRKKPERASMLRSLATLYARGYPVKWNRMHRQGGRLVKLPAYPWQRQRFWMEMPEAAPGKSRANGATALLERKLETAEPVWESELSIKKRPELYSSKLFGVSVLPHSEIVSASVAALSELAPGRPVELENLIFERRVVLDEGEKTGFQLLCVSETSPTNTDGVLRAYDRSRKDPTDPWKRNLQATYKTRVAAIEPDTIDIEKRFAQLKTEMNAGDFYARLSKYNSTAGGAYQTIESVRHDAQAAIARLSQSQSLNSGVIAGGMQLIQSALLGEPASDHAWVAGSLERVLVVSAEPVAWVQAEVASSPAAGGRELAGDIRFYSASGGLVSEIVGMRFAAVDHPQFLRESNRGLKDWIYQLDWRKSAAASATAPASPGSVLIFGEADDGPSMATMELLKQQGFECVLALSDEKDSATDRQDIVRVRPSAPEDFKQLIQNTKDLQGVIYLWGWGESEAGVDWVADQQKLCGSLLHLVQSLAGASLTPRLLLATRGAQAVKADEPVPAFSRGTLWGMGAVIEQEYPELGSKRIDFEPGVAGEAASLLVAELLTGDRASRLAYRRGERYTQFLEREDTRTASSREQGQGGHKPEAVVLESRGRGLLENLELQAITRRLPAPDEVELEVLYTGLNFRDVLSALDSYPEGPVPLGVECMGRIKSLGENVEGLKVGDEVLAICTEASFASYTITHADLVVRKPVGMARPDAATLPLVFLTGYYAFYHLARIKEKDRVLIHSAAGGVGLAAIQIARHFGAEVFATVSTDEKREYLKSIGVEHIFDSRSLDFADQVLKATNGEGVDIVLNSLRGEFVEKGLSILRKGGRFLEIGKKDILSAREVAKIRKNVSYFVIDLMQVAMQTPDLVHSLLSDLVQEFEAGKLKPIPHRLYPLAQVEDAFRYMSRGKHVGKIVVRHGALAGRDEFPGVRPDASYLITGGLGGLGLLFARHLAEQGAGAVVLTGRRKPSADVLKTIQEIESGGHTKIVTMQGNVSDESDLSRIFAHIDSELPPLRGVIHSAGITDDGMLANQSWERYRSVFEAKIAGSLYLHRQTENMRLDFFVLFSSLVSIMGSPGQSNYAAANAYIDSLVWHRRAQGLPALSIHWGPWAEIGMIASLGERGATNWEGRGIQLLPPEIGLQAFDQLLRSDKTEAGAFAVDWQKYIGQYAAGREPAYLINFIDRSGEAGADESLQQQAGPDILEKIATTPVARRESVVRQYVEEHIRRILGMEADRRVEVSKGFKDQGMDSLMTIELRNRLQLGLGCVLPSTLAFDYPTVNTLTAFLTKEILPEKIKAIEETIEKTAPADVAPDVIAPATAVPAPSTATATSHRATPASETGEAPELAPASPGDATAVLAAEELDELSDDDAEALLLQELNIFKARKKT